MENSLDQQIKKPIIILSELNILNSYDYYDSFHTSFQKDKDKEKEKKDLNLEDYFKIDNEKTKELISTFKQPKLNVEFNNHRPDFLRNGKSYIISNGIVKIYDEIMNNIYQINIESNYSIKSGIELNNNDLIFISTITKKSDNTNNNNNFNKFFFYKKNNTHSELLIYRLKDKKYFLTQKIIEDMTGYELQHSYSGCRGYPKHYCVNFLKEISGNRFICITNYGFKIYSLNEKYEYSSILLAVHLEGIKKILEINDKNFIFCTDKHYGASLGGPEHNEIIIEKIKLNEISQNEKEELPYLCKTIFDYSSYGETNYISDSLIIKEKYFIIIFNLHDILIFNLKNGKQVKRYQILDQLNSNLKFYDVDIKPWDSVDENEFILFIDGYAILFKLNEDENENLKLKIINQLYSPNIKDQKLRKIPDKKNKFYSIKEEYINYDKSNFSLNLY